MQKLIINGTEFRFASYDVNHRSEKKSYTMENADVINYVKRYNIVSLDVVAIVTATEYNALLDLVANGELSVTYTFDGDKTAYMDISEITTSKKYVKYDDELYVINFTLSESRR